MVSGSTKFLMVLPQRNTRWLVVAFSGFLGLLWLQQNMIAWSFTAGLVALVIAVVGKKFELDSAGRRYRVGMHLMHRLNPGWQPLPAIQHVVIKPYSYQQVRRSALAAVAHENRWQGFTVLLSMPNSPRGIVVCSVEDEMQAKRLAAEVAFVLKVPLLQLQ